MRTLAPVLIALGLLLVVRALPAGTSRRLATSTTTLVTVQLVVLVTAVLSLLTHEEPAKPRQARADRVGVCAEASAQPRCTALYESLTAVLDVLIQAPLDPGTPRSTPHLVVPGRGDLYLIQTQVTTATPDRVEADLRAALLGAGWTEAVQRQDLLRFRRGSLVADLRITPAGAGTRVELTASFQQP